MRPKQILGDDTPLRHDAPGSSRRGPGSGFPLGVEVASDSARAYIVNQSTGTVHLVDISNLFSPMLVSDPDRPVGSTRGNANQAVVGRIAVVETVRIEIKPGSFPNSINVNDRENEKNHGGGGVILVAIRSTPEFADPSTIDITTMRLEQESRRAYTQGTSPT